MNEKDAALIEYAHKQADFVKRLQSQITALKERVEKLETEPRDQSGLMMDCPQPFAGCRPGACNCDGVYERARLDGHDPETAVHWYLHGVRDGRESISADDLIGLLAERLAEHLTSQGFIPEEPREQRRTPAS